MWPGAKVDQILPVRNGGRTTRAGVAVITRPGRATLLVKRTEIAEIDNKGLSQKVLVRINKTLYVAGLYRGPQTSTKVTEKTIDQGQGKVGRRTVIVGDLNATNRSWDRVSNKRGTAVVKWAKNRKTVVTAPTYPSYWVKGILGESKQDILVDEESASVTKPRDEN